MYYEIVPMDRGHVDQIAELERQCFSTPWSETQLEDALYNDAACFIVAEDGEGGVLGYAGLHVVQDEGYIDNIAVEEAARRHGVASALLDALKPHTRLVLVGDADQLPSVGAGNVFADLIRSERIETVFLLSAVAHVLLAYILRLQ